MDDARRTTDEDRSQKLTLSLWLRWAKKKAGRGGGGGGGG